MKTNKEKSQFIASVFNFFATGTQKDLSLSQLAISLGSQSDFYQAISQVKSKYDVLKQSMFEPTAMIRALEHWIESFLERE